MPNNLPEEKIKIKSELPDFYDSFHHFFISKDSTFLFVLFLLWCMFIVFTNIPTVSGFMNRMVVMLKEWKGSDGEDEW